MVDQVDVRVTENLPEGCEWIDLPVRGDHRGSLIAIEQRSTLPFDIERIYYLFGTRAGVTRGLHAHRVLRQFAVALRGSCTMMLDDGERQVRVVLDNPARGILLPPMVWHEMADFSPGCVLLVAADAPYDESDYIRDRIEFTALVSGSTG